MSGLPWSKFFWSDYASDPALKLCSFAAQGLWMRMLCIAAEHQPVGYVAVNGKGLDATGIARITGGTPTEVEELLAELDGNSVFARDRRGWIYSRRLVKDAKKRDTARENGKKGGNPKLGKEKDNSGWDNQIGNGEDNTEPKPQKPEARDSVADATGGKPPDPLKDLFDVGVALLTSTGLTEQNARSLIGKWRKPKDRSDGEVLQALIDCRTRGISNPVEWLEKRFAGASEWISETGYRYRGDAEDVLRQAEKRADWNTYWKVKSNMAQAA